MLRNFRGGEATYLGIQCILSYLKWLGPTLFHIHVSEIFRYVKHCLRLVMIMVHVHTCMYISHNYQYTCTVIYSY